MSSPDADVDRFFTLSLDLLAIAAIGDRSWRRVNPAFTRTLGWSSEELEFRCFLDLVHPDDLERTDRAVRDLGAGSAVSNFEVRVRCKDGQYKRISWSTCSQLPEGWLYCVGRDVTETYRASETVRRAEEQYRRLVSLLPAAVYACDAQGEITYYNEQAARLWGRAPLTGEAHERSNGAFQLFRPDGSPLPHEQAPMATALHQGTSFRGAEMIVHRPDGSRRHVAVNVDPLRDTEGKITGAINVLTDVTERKLAEEALRASEQRFQSVLENMSEGLMLFDAGGNLIYQNPASLRIHGFENEQQGRIEKEKLPVTWKAWDEAGRLIDFNEWPVARVFRHERFQDQVLRVVRVETGQEFYGSYNGSPIYDSERKLLFGFITIRDITEQVSAREGIRQRDRRLRAFFESELFGAVFWTMDGRFTEANDKFLKMLGYSRQDFEEGRINWRRMTPPEYRHLDDFALQELVETGVDTPYEKEFIRKDGGRVPVFIGAALLGEPRTEGVAFVLDVTEHQKSKQAALIAHQKLQNVINSITDGLMVLDREWKITYFSETAARILEVPAKDVVGRIIWEYFPHALGSRFEEFYRRAMETGQTQRFEEYYPEPLSQWFDCRCYPGPEGLTVYFSDVTQRKLAEAALRESEAQLRTTVDHLVEGVIVCDLEGRTLHWNPAAIKMHGFESPEEALKSLPEYAQLYELKDMEGQLLPFQEWPLSQILRGAILQNWQVRVRRSRDGFERVFAYGGSLARDPEGRPLFAVLTISDITENHEKEAALRSSELFHRQVLESIPGMVFTTRPDGYCDYQSQQWMDYTGVPLEQQLGDGWNRLLHPEDQPRALAAWQQAVAGNAPYDLEYRVRRRDGEYEWFKVIGRPIRDDAGQIVRWFGVAANIHKLKHAEEALRHRAEEIERLMDVTPAAVWVAYDPECLLIVGNRRANELYEAEEGENVSASSVAVRRYFTPEGRELAPEELPMQLAAAKNQNVRNVELQALLPSGKCIALLGNATPLRNDQGKVRGCVGVFIDISERKQAELKLQEALHRFSLLAETAEALLTATDLQHVAESLCEKVIRHLKCDVYFNFLTTEDPRRLRLNACAGISQEQAREIQWLETGRAVCGCVAQDRRPIIAEDIQYQHDERTTLVKSYGVQAYCCHPLMAGDRLLGTLSFGSRSRARFSRAEVDLMRAVTNQVAMAMERMRAAKAVVESEERLRLAKAASRIGIHDFNPVTGELIWDERLRELWDLAPNDPVNYQVFMAGVHPEDRAATDAAVKQALDPAGNGECYVEYRLLKHGQTRWIAATGHATFEGGTAVRFVGTAQDITQQKEFRAELERLVAERTAKLHELVGELEHFSYSITHDMRAPLRALRGFTEIAEELSAEFSGPELKSCFKRIATSAERMDLLITDALSYSKTVREEFPLAPVDVGVLLRGMMDTYPEFLANGRHIQIQGELPVVWGNKAALTQCFSNLIGNALKFVAPEKDPWVRVRAENTGNGGHADWVRFWVEDHGIGIPEVMLPRIFQMFARGTTQYEGTGIGLALVRKVVERMGGRVGVDSKPGEGSRFWVELRRASEENWVAGPQ